jgi:cytochrome c-type biogenesis protein CcmH
MSRWLGWVAIGWMLALCVVILIAYGHPASHPTLGDRTRSLAAQLRCPICHGESVADSPSDIARSIQVLIRQRLARGQSPEAIKRYLVSRYGSTILLAPPTSGVGGIAWLAPPLLLLGGLGLLLTLIGDWLYRGRRPVADRPEYLERVRAELADIRGDLHARNELTE